jgi:hypothetical protein
MHEWRANGIKAVPDMTIDAGIKAGIPGSAPGSARRKRRADGKGSADFSFRYVVKSNIEL